MVHWWSLTKHHWYLLCLPTRRPTGQEGFVPANYMEEVDPAKLQRKVKKKVLVPTKVKVGRLCVVIPYSGIFADFTVGPTSAKMKFAN